MLHVEGLEARYGLARVLFGVSFTVAAGEAVVLLGPNGAGKSTTLKAVMGMVADTGGVVRFRGEDLSRLPAHLRARRGLGYVPEERRIFTELTLEENLEVGRAPARLGLEPWTPARLQALFPNLAEMRGRRGGEMSGGEQQMLSVARTLMGNPALLLLDEPSEGLAPIIVERMADALEALKQTGISILLAEQNAAFADRLADRMVRIERGLVV